MLRAIIHVHRVRRVIGESFLSSEDDLTIVVIGDGARWNRQQRSNDPLCRARYIVMQRTVVSEWEKKVKGGIQILECRSLRRCVNGNQSIWVQSYRKCATFNLNCQSRNCEMCSWSQHGGSALKEKSDVFTFDARKLLPGLCCLRLGLFGMSYHKFMRAIILINIH